MQDGMQENAKTEHISEAYPVNPYVYDYHGNKMTVNVSTLATKEFGEKGLIN